MVSNKLTMVRRNLNPLNKNNSNNNSKAVVKRRNSNNNQKKGEVRTNHKNNKRKVERRRVKSLLRPDLILRKSFLP
jgi:hypothetical protein